MYSTNKLSTFIPLVLTLIYLICPSSLGSEEENETIDFESVEEKVITIESALQRVACYNRELLDLRESLTKAEFYLDNEIAYFSWDVTPDGIFGYTNGPNKHKDSDLSYGVGVSLSKKFSYGTKLYLNPSISKRGKGFQADVSTTLVQPLLRGRGKGYTMSRVASAKFSQRTAYRQFYMKNVKVLQDTIRRLYQVAKQETAVKLNLESVERLTYLAAGAKLKERSGLATATDIYRAEHELKNAEERYTTSMEQLKDAEDRVREILALPEDAPIHVHVPITDVDEEIELSVAIEIAQTNRMEIDQSKDALRESKRLCSLDKQDLLPDLNLILEHTNACYYDTFKEIYPDKFHKYWKVGLTTSKGISSQAQLNRFELSKLAVESSIRAVERTNDSIIQDVKRAHRSYYGLKRKLQIAVEQLELSEVNLELSTLKFNRGLANNFDLIQAEKNLHQEQLHLFTQRIDQMLELVNLRVVMGVFCDKPSIPY